MRSFLRQITLAVCCVAVTLQQASAVDANSRHASLAGLDSVRGGSAVRTPTKKALLEKKEQIRRDVADRRQQLKKQVVAAKAKNIKAMTQKPSFVAQHKPAIAGVLALTVLERGINKIFVQKGIKFPAQLAGCVGLFFAMLMADIVRPGTGESIYSKLLPGTNLLAKWFPVLFVPGLVMLPLAPSIGNGMEVGVVFLGSYMKEYLWFISFFLTLSWRSLHFYVYYLLLGCQICICRRHWIILFHVDHWLHGPISSQGPRKICRSTYSFQSSLPVCQAAATAAVVTFGPRPPQLGAQGLPG
jgi:hypothetical protein